MTHKGAEDGLQKHNSGQRPYHPHPCLGEVIGSDGPSPKPREDQSQASRHGQEDLSKTGVGHPQNPRNLNDALPSNHALHHHQNGGRQGKPPSPTVLGCAPNPCHDPKSDEPDAGGHQPMGVLEENKRASRHPGPRKRKHVMAERPGPIRHRHARNLRGDLSSDGDQEKDRANQKTGRPVGSARPRPGRHPAGTGRGLAAAPAGRSGSGGSVCMMKSFA